MNNQVKTFTHNPYGKNLDKSDKKVDIKSPTTKISHDNRLVAKGKSESKITHNEFKPTTKPIKPIKKTVKTQPHKINEHVVKQEVVNEEIVTKAEPQMENTIDTNSEVPHVTHTKKSFKNDFIQTETPSFSKGKDQNTFTHSKVEKRVKERKPVPIKPEVLEVPKEQHRPTPVVPQVVDGPKNLDTLTKQFTNDIPVIINDILDKRTNFEEYDIGEIKFEGLDIIRGEEGIAHGNNEHAFTLRTPTPIAMTFFVKTILDTAYSMGYDKLKLTAMLIETMTMSESIGGWLKMMIDLWDELLKQRKI